SELSQSVLHFLRSRTCVSFWIIPLRPPRSVPSQSMRSSVEVRFENNTLRNFGKLQSTGPRDRLLSRRKDSSSEVSGHQWLASISAYGQRRENPMPNTSVTALVTSD